MHITIVYLYIAIISGLVGYNNDCRLGLTTVILIINRYL